MINIFWFRRDLRLNDNHGLFKALNAGRKVLPLFIFDTEILQKLESTDDARVQFIHNQIEKIDQQLKSVGSSMHVVNGNVTEVFNDLCSKYEIEQVFCNSDYEPYGIARDFEVNKLLGSKNINFQSFKDHVIFEKDEVLKPDGKPYTVFTPYSRKWKDHFNDEMVKPFPSETYLENFIQKTRSLPSLTAIGFQSTPIKVPEIMTAQERLQSYADTRNLPAIDGTSHVGPHLRFGTISIRNLVKQALSASETYLNELIWREFFMQILFHFPYSANENFNSKYKHLEWRNNEKEFKLWCEGRTGFPMVDAGMRELNETGHMHNRVRMVVASFLTKHLLIDWRWGEAYFASKLLDFELASNVGNWQWAAGTGCDAAPYFRVFNPSEQLKKFDSELKYVSKWVPEINDLNYCNYLIVDHAFARNRALETYKKALAQFQH
ncbi:MAG: deoxyribodipyrimidine photo-lyase [Bacteroidales bacterium]|nr:deoxyribodipyrimidine photo-lyase [Bacteroidales bacterium]